MSDYRTRTRKEITRFPDSVYSQTWQPVPGVPKGAKTLWSSSYKPIRKYETVRSRGNPGWNYGSISDRRVYLENYSPTSDSGGTFDVKTFEVTRNDYTMGNLYQALGGIGTYCPMFVNSYGYVGETESWINSSLGNANLSMSDSAMDALGSKLSSIASPTRPRASLAQALIELRREGLPSLRSALLHGVDKKSAKAIFSGAGSDYLNAIFGWMPLINDIMQLAKALTDAEQLLRQFRANSGKRVRRRTNVQTNVISSTQTSTGNAVPYPVGSTYYYSKKGTLGTFDTYIRDTWFSGAFKYIVPNDPSMLSQFAALNVESRYLLGLSLDPKTIWSVIGWTWLIDWFVNAGPLLESFTAQYMNQQVMEYGYIMSTSRRVWKQVLSGAQMNTYPSGVIQFDGEYHETLTHKQRRQATPYGFGLTWTGFTQSQLAILAALGISKRR